MLMKSCELFSDRFRDVLKGEFSNNDFSDLTIQCKNGFVLAHRLLLATYSETMRTHFEMTQRRNREMLFEEFPKEIVKKVLETLYLGVAQLDDNEQLLECQNLIDFLKIEGITIVQNEIDESTSEESIFPIKVKIEKELSEEQDDTSLDSTSYDINSNSGLSGTKSHDINSISNCTSTISHAHNNTGDSSCIDLQSELRQENTTTANLINNELNETSNSISTATDEVPRQLSSCIKIESGKRTFDDNLSNSENSKRQCMSGPSTSDTTQQSYKLQPIEIVYKPAELSYFKIEIDDPLYSNNENSDITSTAESENLKGCIDCEDLRKNPCNNLLYVTHLLIKHKETETFWCKVCSEVFPKNEALIRHMQLKHSRMYGKSIINAAECHPSRLICETCDLFFAKRFLKTHKSIVHNAPYCPFCSNVLPCSYEEHMMFEHKKKYKMSKC